MRTKVQFHLKKSNNIYSILLTTRSTAIAVKVDDDGQAGFGGMFVYQSVKFVDGLNGPNDRSGMDKCKCKCQKEQNELNQRGKGLHGCAVMMLCGA